MLDWLRLPVAASAHAGDIDRVMALVHWLMLVLFLGWSAFFVYVPVRFRSGRQPQASYHGLSLFAVVRVRALPDARVLYNSVAGRLRGVAG
jgi:hypothetical protein